MLSKEFALTDRTIYVGSMYFTVSGLLLCLKRSMTLSRSHGPTSWLVFASPEFRKSESPQPSEITMTA